MSGISRRLLRPAHTLRQLTSSLRDTSIDRRRLSGRTQRIQRSYIQLSHVVSSLLVLVGTRRPIATSRTGHYSLFSRISKTISSLTNTTQSTKIRIQINNGDPIVVRKRTSRVHVTIHGVIRGTVICSRPNKTINISITLSSSKGGTIIHIVSRNRNIPGTSLPHVFRQFCHNSGRGRHAASNVNLKLTVIGRTTLTRRNSIAI